MEVPGYTIRPFSEEDRPAALAFGQPVIDWWNAQCPALHLTATPIAGGDIVAHLQIADRSYPQPSRRPGECQLRLIVSPEHRRRGLGGALYARAEAFAREQNATSITAAYFEHPDGAPGAPFLAQRGFVPYERYHPSHLDLADFDPEKFAAAIARVEQEGIRLFTYSEAGDTEEHRRQLYALECAARAVQPYRQVGTYIPPTYEEWEQEMAEWPQETIFLACAPTDDTWVGMISGLVWGFAGVHPDWQGRGIATALKVWALTAAKAQGMTRIETENHEDNRAMLAINHKLGFVADPIEVNCILRL
jgi:mycothiol synthase